MSDKVQDRSGAGRAVQDGLDPERLRAALFEAFDSEDGFEWRTPGTLDQFTQDVIAEYARLAAPPSKPVIGEVDR